MAPQFGDSKGQTVRHHDGLGRKHDSFPTFMASTESMKDEPDRNRVETEGCKHLEQDDEERSPAVSEKVVTDTITLQGERQRSIMPGSQSMDVILAIILTIDVMVLRLK